jgi:hypothetical protein
VQWLLNLPIVLWRRLLLILQGLGALLALVATGIRALLGKGGTFGSRIAAALGSSEDAARRSLADGLAKLRQEWTPA